MQPRSGRPAREGVRYRNWQRPGKAHLSGLETARFCWLTPVSERAPVLMRLIVSTISAPGGSLEFHCDVGVIPSTTSANLPKPVIRFEISFRVTGWFVRDRPRERYGCFHGDAVGGYRISRQIFDRHYHRMPFETPCHRDDVVTQWTTSRLKCTIGVPQGRMSICGPSSG